MGVQLVGGILRAICANCGYEATTGERSDIISKKVIDLSEQSAPIEFSHETGDPVEGTYSVVQMLQNDGWKVNASILLICICPQCAAKEEAAKVAYEKRVAAFEAEQAAKKAAEEAAVIEAEEAPTEEPPAIDLTIGTVADQEPAGSAKETWEEKEHTEVVQAAEKQLKPEETEPTEVVETIEEENNARRRLKNPKRKTP